MPKLPEASEITVSAWSQRYASAVAAVLAREGGFVDDKADRGGATKYGISLRFLKAEGGLDLDRDGHNDFDLDMDGDLDAADIRKLTPANARFLYYRCFWQRLDCESLPSPIGEMVFDQGVNGGNLAAKKLLQRAINARLGALGKVPLKVDGQIGEVTRAALRNVIVVGGIDELAEAFREAVRARYRAIVAADPRQKRFLRGWLARADELGR